MFSVKKRVLILSLNLWWISKIQLNKIDRILKLIFYYFWIERFADTFYCRVRR